MSVQTILLILAAVVMGLSVYANVRMRKRRHQKSSEK